MNTPVKKNAARQGSREGKKSFTVWLDEDQARQLKIAAAIHGATQEAIVTEGIALMLEERYRP